MILKCVAWLNLHRKKSSVFTLVSLHTRRLNTRAKYRVSETRVKTAVVAF